MIDIPNFEKIEVGIDLVKIDRFRSLPYNENKTFYTKNFSREEIEYCLTFSNSAEHFAGKFAIKESVKKILKTKINMIDIETGYIESKPTVRISLKKNQFKVSVSHDGDYAIAIVLCQKME